MKELQAAVAAFVQAETGLRTVERRSECRVYPALVVNAEQTACTLLDGGRQIERRFAVTIQAATDRERQGADGILSRLCAALSGGVPMGGRVLHPLEIKSQGDTLSFTLQLCQFLPQGAGGGDKALWMETLHVCFT